MKEKNKLLIRATTPVNLTCILWHERRISRHQGFVKGKGWVWSDSGQQCLQCCGCDKQIHTDYWNPVEKKGWHGHSLRERMPQPLPGQALLLSNSIHQRRFSSIMLRFALGDYFWQVTKERMLLITSYRLTRKKCCKCKGTIRVIGLVTLHPWEN